MSILPYKNYIINLYNIIVTFSIYHNPNYSTINIHKCLNKFSKYIFKIFVNIKLQFFSTFLLKFVRTAPKFGLIF